MSEAERFTELTNLVDIDPFALLGISVSADEKRIAKRYRQVAKQLHPDALASADTADGLSQVIAEQVIARIVNPSYQKLKHERTRQETLSLLRFRVRRLVRTEKLIPTFADAIELSDIDDNAVDIFYEQALSKLAQQQFQSIQALHTHSLEIGQLNLMYLRRKLSDLVIRPKRAGLMTTAVTPTAASPSANSAATANGLLSQVPNSSDSPVNGPQSGPLTAAPKPVTDYLAKHLTRAKTYLKKQSYEQAVQELREAIKLAPQNPEIHSMLGQSYFKQKMSGMAKAHFRQALKLKPDHKVAQKYGKLLGLLDEPITDPHQPARPPDANPSPPDKSAAQPTDKTASKTAGKGAWLGRFLNR